MHYKQWPRNPSLCGRLLRRHYGLARLGSVHHVRQVGYTVARYLFLVRFDQQASPTRYEPPTLLAPTLVHSIPSRFLNPIPHLLSVTTSLTPSHVSIRLLAISESPRTAATGSAPGTDSFTELCASLVAQIGKMKRTVMGWEDKTAFLEFYRKKR
jgi:hypothetical protein